MRSKPESTVAAKKTDRQVRSDQGGEEHAKECTSMVHD